MLHTEKQQLRYPCLILDHDDTVVDSTAHVHYPAYMQGMPLLRPECGMTLQEYFEMNFEPGIFVYYRDVLKLTDEENEYERRLWLKYVDEHVPQAYPGIAELIRTQRALGGSICVISHSEKKNILRDYRENNLPEPDMIFGSELPKSKCKPESWPVEEILRRLGLKPGQALVVDDLKPGYEMAVRAGADFAAACWAHNLPQIRGFFETNCAHCFYSPEELSRWLFGA